VLDLAALTVVSYGLLCGSRRRPSSALLAAGLAAFALADIVYATITLGGGYAYGSMVDAGWLVGYLLLGAAALHPSIGRPIAHDPAPSSVLSRPRQLLVVGALVVAVAALAEMPLSGPHDIVAALAGSILIVLLVVARLFGALGENDRRLAESRMLRAELRSPSRTDALTGLPNRQAFLDALDDLLRGPGAWVMFLDLDGFKPINDGFGHAAGDELLRVVASRLT
jgi:hypothetical protein